VILFKLGLCMKVVLTQQSLIAFRLELKRA
jgi:hypothetical protein